MDFCLYPITSNLIIIWYIKLIIELNNQIIASHGQKHAQPCHESTPNCLGFSSAASNCFQCWKRQIKINAYFVSTHFTKQRWKLSSVKILNMHIFLDNSNTLPYPYQFNHKLHISLSIKWDQKIISKQRKKVLFFSFSKGSLESSFSRQLALSRFLSKVKVQIGIINWMIMWQYSVMCHFVGNFFLLHSQMKLISWLLTYSLKKFIQSLLSSTLFTQLQLWCSTW